MQVGGVWRILLAQALLLAGAFWQPSRSMPVELPALKAPVFAEQGEGCDQLAQFEPIHLLVRVSPGLAGRVGVGYRNPATDRVVVPARTLLLPLQPGPLGVQWDQTARTATFLRGGNVISLHFAEGRNRTEFAILNGEVVTVESMICEGRTYVALSLLAEGLMLRTEWRDPNALLLQPRD